MKLIDFLFISLSKNIFEILILNTKNFILKKYI